MLDEEGVRDLQIVSHLVSLSVATIIFFLKKSRLNLKVLFEFEPRGPKNLQGEELEKRTSFSSLLFF